MEIKKGRTYKVCWPSADALRKVKVVRLEKRGRGHTVCYLTETDGNERVCSLREFEADVARAEKLATKRRVAKAVSK